MRNVMRNWMLGTALVAGLLGTGAVAANAAPREFRGTAERGFDRGNFRTPERGFYRPVERGFYRPGYALGYGAPVVEGYIPPCPGDGYVWLGGAWVFRGGYGVARRGYGYGPVARFDRSRGFDRGYRGRR